MTNKRRLSMDVLVGQSVSIDGGRVVLTVEAKSGQRARIAFSIDPDVVLAKLEQGPPAASAAREGIRWSR